MTRRTWTIAWHEYLTNVRRPGFIFATLLIPALGLVGLIVATFFSGQALGFLREQFGPQGVRVIGVVDRSGLYGAVPPAAADRFQLYADEAAARAALEAEAVVAYLVIPADYVATGEVLVYGANDFNSEIALDSEDLNAFLIDGLLAGRVEDAVRARAVAPSRLQRVAEAAPGEGAAPASPLAVVGGLVASMGVSVLLFVSIMVSSNYLLRSVSEEKENRVMEVVLSSVSAADLLWGKVIGLGALGLTQVLVWLGSGVALTGGVSALAVGALAALNPGTMLLALVYFVLGYLLYGVLMAAAGSLGTSMRESQQIGGLFSFGAAIPWMLNGFLIANPNFGLARVLSWFPLTAPMMMMLRLPYGQTPWIDIVGSIAGLVVSVPVVMWAGAKVFRTSLLVYGKRLSIAELWSALRRA